MNPQEHEQASGTWAGALPQGVLGVGAHLPNESLYQTVHLRGPQVT